MMTYIPDSGPDTGVTSRTFLDRFQAIRDSWPDDSTYVVDFGAYNGRMAGGLADALALRGVAIEGDHELMPGRELIKNVSEFVSPRDLGAIIRDYPGATVLCLSVLHHLSDWRKYVGAIERNASYAFIETANPDEVLPTAKAHSESAAILRWVEKRGVKVGESAGWDSRFLRSTWRLDFGE